MRKAVSIGALMLFAALCAASTQPVPRFSVDGALVHNGGYLSYADPLPNGDVPFLFIGAVTAGDGRPLAVLQVSCIREDGSECEDPASSPDLTFIRGGVPPSGLKGPGGLK